MLSPYTPGAGTPPRYLAGRGALLETASNTLEALKAGFPRQPVVYYGLRGVGKTVLLGAVERKAESRQIICGHIEVSEKKGFKTQFSQQVYKLANRTSALEATRNSLKRFLGIFRAFVATWSAEGEIKFGLDAEAYAGIADTGDFANDFVEILCGLGTLARECGKHICLFVDEVQDLKPDEWDALIVAMHRINQLRLPVAFFAAGLSKVVKMVAEVRSYTERLFNFVEVDSLDFGATASALAEPARAMGVVYAPDALEDVYEITDGYPFFVQKFGDCVWPYAYDGLIDRNCVSLAEKDFLAELDVGFFKARFDKTTATEKKFLYAMAGCESYPYNVAEIAQALGRTVRSISALRIQLIEKGLIYAENHGELRFTVPLFDEFLKRQNPGCQTGATVTAQ